MLIWTTALMMLAAAEPTPVAVPYTLTETKHLLVRARINDRGPFHFVLDTGAPALFLSTSAARRAGLTTEQDGWGVIDRFDIEGGVRLAGQPVKIEDLYQLDGMNGLNLAGTELHGVMGYNVLARFRIHIDLTSDKLEFTPLHFNPPPIQRFGRAASAGGLEATAGMMKTIGALLGTRATFIHRPRGFLGLELSETEGTVTVAGVLTGGPAAEAGLKAGDVIREWSGRPVKSLADVARITREKLAGDSARLNLDRAGQPVSVTVRLGKGL